MKSNLTKWPYYSGDEKKIVNQTLSSGKVNYWTGNLCRKFETDFSNYIGTNYAISLNNGTVAIELALMAMNISNGDEVIVTPRSYVASVSSVVNVGAKPIFADIDPQSGNLTSETISKVISKKTKAVICVHITGIPCEMDKIMSLAKKMNLKVIEDCSQAHGAEYKGKKVGSFGDISTWSFCQDKIISTGGEGGMVTTNKYKFWNKIWKLKDHGKNHKKMMSNNSKKTGFKWVHDDFGSNYRMTEMQAGIGITQLKKLDKWQKIREANSLRIINKFKEYKDAVEFFNYPKEMKFAWYRCCILINENKLNRGWSRDRIIREFNNNKIPCFVGPCPEIYLEKSFQKNNFSPKKRLKNAFDLGKMTIAFLVHPTLRREDVNNICDAIQKIMTKASLKQ